MNSAAFHFDRNAAIGFTFFKIRSRFSMYCICCPCFSFHIRQTNCFHKLRYYICILDFNIIWSRCIMIWSSFITVSLSRHHNLSTCNLFIQASRTAKNNIFICVNNRHSIFYICHTCRCSNIRHIYSKIPILILKSINRIHSIRWK